MTLGLEDKDFEFESGLHLVYNLDHEERVSGNYDLHVLYMEVREVSTYCVKGVVSFINCAREQFTFEAGMLPRGSIMWSILEMSPCDEELITRFAFREMGSRSYALYEQYYAERQLEHA